MPLPDGCPLDPGEYASAMRPLFGGAWIGKRHGDDQLWPAELARCACEPCMTRLAVVDPDAAVRARERRAAAAPKRVDVGPAREHIRELVGRGWSLTRIATAAGVDKTTVVRAMRPDVKRLYVSTADAVLAVGA